MLLKSVSEIKFEAAFQNLAIKNKKRKEKSDTKWYILPCPYTMPMGVSLLAYRETSPGNMTQCSIAVIG